MEAVQCPKCSITMREREKGQIIIDICPQCRGVWLDAGELEKLSVRESRYYDDDDDDDDDWDDRRQGGFFGGRGDERDDDRSRVDSQGRPRRKRGFLSSMMESFGGDD